jgi:hypothetical protein
MENNTMKTLAIILTLLATPAAAWTTCTDFGNTTSCNGGGVNTTTTHFGNSSMTTGTIGNSRINTTTTRFGNTSTTTDNSMYDLRRGYIPQPIRTPSIYQPNNMYGGY